MECKLLLKLPILIFLSYAKHLSLNIYNGFSKFYYFHVQVYSTINSTIAFLFLNTKKVTCKTDVRLVVWVNKN